VKDSREASARKSRISPIAVRMSRQSFSDLGSIIDSLLVCVDFSAKYGIANGTIANEIDFASEQLFECRF